MSESQAFKKLLAFVSELQLLADKVLMQHRGNPNCIQAQPFAHLHTSVRLLIDRLGGYGLGKEVLTQGMPKVTNETNESVHRIKGLLDSVSNALQHGRLATVEELITADILTDLLEQAGALLAAEYFLPAAVILRAILEERLRKLCVTHNCPPSVPKSTIEHFKQALYAAKVIDKITQKKIDWMAGVGNAAAHNLPEFRDQDVPVLFKDTLDLLARFSV